MKRRNGWPNGLCFMACRCLIEFKKKYRMRKAEAGIDITTCEKICTRQSRAVQKKASKKQLPIHSRKKLTQYFSRPRIASRSLLLTNMPVSDGQASGR